MTGATQPAHNERAGGKEDGAGGGATVEQFDSRFHVRLALTERGLNFAEFTTDELQVLEECLWERLSHP